MGNSYQHQNKMSVLRPLSLNFACEHMLAHHFQMIKKNYKTEQNTNVMCGRRKQVYKLCVFINPRSIGKVHKWHQNIGR